MSEPQAVAGAGEKKALRRWRVTVTVGGWLLFIQSATGVVFGALSLLAASGFQPESIVSQLGPVFSGANIAMVNRLMEQMLLVNKFQVVANTVIAAGAFGLVRRWKWGWYLTIAVHLLEIAAAFVWAQPVISDVLRLLDPVLAVRLSWLIATLVATVPASIVVFLMLRPVVRQFEPTAN